ncbi:MAG: methyltransferase [Pseudomonadota bacterium]
MAQITELIMENMASLGEAIVTTDENPIYVRFALPGEKVKVDIAAGRGNLLEVVTPSPDRITPICPHFTICGGCALQHWSEPKVLEWKADLIRRALDRVAIEIPNGAIKVNAAWGKGRRRAKFTAKRENGIVLLGFMGQKSNSLVDISECAILTENLQAALPKLRELAKALIGEAHELTLNVTESASGLDVDIVGLKPIEKYGRQELEKLARVSQIAGLARLTLAGHNAFVQATPYVIIGDVAVDIPANSFLQASENCENQLAEVVIKWAKGKKRIADLFCGIGTFALRLKKSAEVTAYEMHQESVFALNSAAKKAAGGHTLKAFSRDLFRVPVAPLELKNIDLVVLNPARQGAEAQCKQLVRAKINEVVYISCDPTSFARDAKILIDGGFELSEIHGFDQFRFSPHVELAAKFARK